MVALLVAIVLEGARNHLLLRDIFESQEFTLILIRSIVEAVAGRAAGLAEESRLISG